MAFSRQRLLETINQLPQTRCYWIGYSGGLDSHVLLHAMAALRPMLAPARLEAVHVDHGLSPNAGAWTRHCAAVCERLGVPYRIVRVDARPRGGEGPEAAARRARYAAFGAVMEAGDCLVTAHHRNDQAETMVLQLLRGAGPHGLAGMAPVSPFAAGIHARPLLSYLRAELLDYARDEGLSWVEDESNADVSRERNYLRHEILPRLRRHWPALDKTLARTAAHNREAAAVLDAVAAEDFAAVHGTDRDFLSVDGLRRLGSARMRNVIRYWLKQRDLPTPGSGHLRQIEVQVFESARDRGPRVCWPGAEVRRYRDGLYAFAPLPDETNDAELAWDVVSPISLPASGGTLSAERRVGAGIKADLCYSDAVTVRFRRGGESCQPTGSQHHRTLKNLFQERGIPPWVRKRIPLVYIGGRLAAVADYWVCQPYQALPHERGVVFHWHRSARGLG